VFAYVGGLLCCAGRETREESRRREAKGGAHSGTRVDRARPLDVGICWPLYFWKRRGWSLEGPSSSSSSSSSSTLPGHGWPSSVAVCSFCHHLGTLREGWVCTLVGERHRCVPLGRESLERTHLVAADPLFLSPPRSTLQMHGG